MRAFTLKKDPLTGEEFYEIYIRGRQLLGDPLLNKGSSFTEEERTALGLQGLLRPAINSLEQQVERVQENQERKSATLERYIGMLSLLDRNETLFYKVLCDNLEEYLPIVYTPVVGEACMQMSHIIRRYRGVYLSRNNISHIDEIFRNVAKDIALIVVTDGERILGLGDLGSDGMGIPVGKLNLYVAAAGIHPSCCLPICLDVGTNCQRLLDDPVYLGDPRPRMTGQAYDDFVERFVLGVRRNFPNALLQWEDFAKHTAFKLLERYRERILSFNDDIQGTGATALAALMSAMRTKKSTFAEQRFVIVGMGQAGTGIARNIRTMLLEEGLSEAEARRRILAIDQNGLLVDGDPNIEEPQVPFVQDRAAVAGWKLEQPGRVGLYDCIVNAGATVLIGVTAKPGLFDQKVLSALAKNTPQPIVLPLSNPTSKCECSVEEFVRATDGRGLIATGSPFSPVKWNGRTFRASQCNNLYVFPGVGLGVLMARALKVTDKMFLAASRTLSELVTDEQRAEGLLLPEMTQIREVSARVALAVAVEARDSGLGRRLDDAALAERIRKAQWQPRYYPYRAGNRRDEQTLVG